MKEENLKKRFLVILADRKKARIFTIFLGKFEGKGEEYIVEDVPQEVKAVDGRQGKIERHIETHLKKHLQNVGKKALDYLIINKIKQVDGVILGTHRELYSELRSSLPSKLRQKVIGEFPVEPNAALGDAVEEVISRFHL